MGFVVLVALGPYLSPKSQVAPYRRSGRSRRRSRRSMRNGYTVSQGVSGAAQRRYLIVDRPLFDTRQASFDSRQASFDTGRERGVATEVLDLLRHGLG